MSRPLIPRRSQLIVKTRSIMKFIFLSLLICLSTIDVYAENKKPTNTIPFATYEVILPGGHSNVQSSEELVSSGNVLMAKKKDSTNIPTNEITSLVQNIRSDVCNAIQPGTVEVWIGIGADEKAIIVNSHFEAGIKVIFDCHSKK